MIPVKSSTAHLKHLLTAPIPQTALRHTSILALSKPFFNQLKALLRQAKPELRGETHQIYESK